MTFQTNLDNSRKIKELVGEVETEKYWQHYSLQSPDKWVLENKSIINYAVNPITGEETDDTERLSSPSLSELALVLKMVGEKKGWGSMEINYGNWDDMRTVSTATVLSWKHRYIELCQIWSNNIHLGEEEANRKVNEMLNNILNQ